MTWTGAASFAHAGDGGGVPRQVTTCTRYPTLCRELAAQGADLFEHVHLENHVLMPLSSGQRHARSKSD